jgi:hypothetical protein
MPGKSLIDQGYNRIVAHVGAVAKPFGFKRRGNLMRLTERGSCAIIQFQRSNSNNAETVRFTLNLSIVCGRLLDGFSPPLDRTSEMHGHVRERIGFLLPQPHDKWWMLDANIAPETIAEEIGSLVADSAIPFLREHLGCDKLQALWESGRAPGLTEFQRVRYLGVLRAEAAT